MSHIHITVSDVSFGYEKGKKVLNHLSFEAGESESIGIIGSNGAGKSTLLKLMVGLHTDFSGSIRIEDMPVEKSMLTKIRERIGYVFQDADSQLFMTTVGEDVAFAPRSYGFSEEEVARRVEKALGAVGISHLKDKQIYRLSGGEKKLASIATILSMTPDILLLDEPSVTLDPKNRRNLIRILNEFSHLKLIATHDLDMVLDTCKRCILICGGEIIKDGRTIEILTDRKLLEENGLELPLRYQGDYLGREK